MLLYGGFTGQELNSDLLQLDPATLEAEPAPAGGDGPPARFAHSAVAVSCAGAEQVGTAAACRRRLPLFAAAVRCPPHSRSCAPPLTGRPVRAQVMLVFGGVSPELDLGDVAVWRA